MTKSTTVFLSYSRRQLYFAEALALHLQKAGLEVWFDLQQLQAGKVWSDGLKDGVRMADRLVLVVSKASLQSPWTRDELQGMVEKGGQLVLAVFEAVELPEELRGLPTYDFRFGFDGKLQDLVAYLEGDAEACRDPVPAPGRLGLPLTIPAALWVTLFALFAPLVGCLLAAALGFVLPPAEKTSVVRWGLLAFSTACGAAIVVRTALPFWRRTITYTRLRRGVFWSLPLGVVAMVSVIGVSRVETPLYFMQIAWLVTFFVYLWLLRRSASILRWMQAGEDVQALRRRVHRPLVETPDVLEGGLEPTSEGFSYALHFDTADQPLARFVESILDREGHERIASDRTPDHHIAILTNRSSQAWVEKLTVLHAGELVYVVASTIELGETLSETARYQWVDFRGGDRRDIETLARTLSNPKRAAREAGLEATPEMIDRWKVPRGASLLRRVTELFGVAALVFGLSDVLGAALRPLLVDKAELHAEWLWRSGLLAMVGLVLLWMSTRALVYRRVPAPVMYGVLVAVSVVVSLWAAVLPQCLQEVPWVPLAIYLPFVLYSLLDGRYWLAGFAPSHRDEVGIKRSIERSFKRRNILKVSVLVALIVALAVGIALTTDPKESTPCAAQEERPSTGGS